MVISNYTLHIASYLTCFFKELKSWNNKYILLAIGVYWDIKDNTAQNGMLVSGLHNNMQYGVPMYEYSIVMATYLFQYKLPNPLS